MPKQRSSSAETLAQLIADVAGERGSGLTYAQLSDRSVDPDSGYKPSANLLNRIALGADIKINPPLIRAITAGLGLPASRVEAAAHRQFIGPYVAVDPGLAAGDDDEVRSSCGRPVKRTHLTSSNRTNPRHTTDV
jgi:hypothetical protein